MLRSTRLVLTLLIALTVLQGGSLVRRAGRGEADFSIFYRTGRLLADGVGADLYPGNDEVSGFPISLSPTGLALLQPLSALKPTAAGTVWALVNFTLVGVSLGALYLLLPAINSPPLTAAFPLAAIVFLVLSAGCIQVGQFSILFVACWVLFLVAYLAERYGLAGFLLALPAAIKVYPLLLLAVPLCATRSLRSSKRDVLWFVRGLVVAAIALPVLVYGSLAWTLDAAFLRHVVFNLAQVDFMRSLRTFANQSLDTVLLRYLTYDPVFHTRYDYMPQLSFDRDYVLFAANAARASIFVITAATAWVWRRTARTSAAHQLLVLAALWSSALYLTLPETKSRYAIYTFLAFLPLLEVAGTPIDRYTRWAHHGAIAACVLLVAGVLPDSLQIWGIGFLGALTLWVGNIALITVPALATERAGRHAGAVESLRRTVTSTNPPMIGLPSARARETP